MVMLLSFKECSNEMQVRWYSTVREHVLSPGRSVHDADIQLFDDHRETAQRTDQPRRRQIDLGGYTESSAQALRDCIAGSQGRIGKMKKLI